VCPKGGIPKVHGDWAVKEEVIDRFCVVLADAST